MAKNVKTSLSEKLGELKGFMKEKESTTPVQQVVTSVVELPTKIEETKFTVHIPTALMDEVKTIGFNRKKKLKTLFVEALEAYVAAQKRQ